MKAYRQDRKKFRFRRSFCPADTVSLPVTNGNPAWIEDLRAEGLHVTERESRVDGESQTVISVPADYVSRPDEIPRGPA
jgi:hypothetical protein